MDWFPTPFEDETLYSILARLFVYMGKPNRSSFSRAISGGRHWVALTQLPCQLDAMSDHFGWDAAFVDHLIDHHSLLPFYTAYASERVRSRARSSMCRSADGLQLMLGISTSPIAAPRHLRFCSNCVEEMRERSGEAWWRRVHQLPGIQVCAIHGRELCDSQVEILFSRRHLLVTADEAICDVQSLGPQPPTVSGRVRHRLTDLARAARQLLIEPPAAGDPLMLHRRIQIVLGDRGLQRGTRQVQHKALRSLICAYWGDVLHIIPGLSIDGPDISDWLVDHVRNRRRLEHPLRHLIVELALATAERCEQPFGSGPWPCLNPIGRHFQKPVIEQFKQVRDRGKIHGHFNCFCGYSYSRTWHPGGRVGSPQFRIFGTSLRPYLNAAIQARKSLRAIAREVSLDPKTLIREALSLGIALPWSTKPSGRLKNSSIS